MEVLNVLSFAGKAEVGHWLEEDDNLPYKLYWRQTYCRETQELSVGFISTPELQYLLTVLVETPRALRLWRLLQPWGTNGDL